MTKGRDLRMLFGALAGVGLGGVALLTVVPVMAPPQTAPRALVPEAGPAAGLALDAGVAADQSADPETALSPRFDTVRIAPDGTGLVAGQAAPGAAVAILAGGDVAAEALADSDGRFVAFLDLSPSAEPRALSLRDGSGGLSEETVIVAPTGVASIQDARDLADAGPDVAAGPEVTEPAASGAGAVLMRDLPLDRPGPDLALADEPDGALPGIGAAAAMTDAGVAGASSTGDATATGSLPGGPTVAPLGPAEGQAPGGVGGTGGPAPGGVTPPAVAIAVAGPSAPPADAPPDHAGVPLVGESPGTLPSSGGEPGQAAVLLSDAEGVRVLQPALAPGADAETLATVALDAIAYGEAGQVQLSGRASGSGAVRVYLDNRPVGDAPVGADGQWSAEIGGAEAGTYTLRVDQIDAEGEVVSRIETPFLREAEGDLADLVGQAQEAGQTIAMRTVQPGNTLWAIARDRYGEPLMYVQVFEMNRDRIRDPDLIYPGQVFVLPATAGR